MSNPLLLWTVPVIVSCLAAVIDFRTGRIPNWLTIPTALLGLITASVVHGASGFAHALVGLLFCAATPLLLHQCSDGQGIGGGDVKLFAALGALGGTSVGLEIEFSSFVLLAVFALVRLAFQGHLLGVLKNVVQIMLRPLRRARSRATLTPSSLTEMRMGPAIAVAVLAVALSERLVGWLPWLV